MKKVKLLNFKIYDSEIIIDGHRNFCEAEYYLFQDYLYIKFSQNFIDQCLEMYHLDKYNFLKEFNSDTEDNIRNIIYKKGIFGDEADKYIVDNIKYLGTFILPKDVLSKYNLKIK